MSGQRSDWRERLHANPSRMETELAINLEHDRIHILGPGHESEPALFVSSGRGESLASRHQGVYSVDRRQSLLDTLYESTEIYQQSWNQKPPKAH